MYWLPNTMKGMHVSDLPDRTQDYLKVIYDLGEWNAGPVTSTRIGEVLGQQASTVSETLKRLVQQGLVVHEVYKPIELSSTGRPFALQMVRRHRLLEMYLCECVGYSWDEVHEEAEHLEHAVSDTFVERIAALMGNPTRDPHGDPIPDKEGNVAETDPGLPLDTAQEGDVVRIVRIADRDSSLLRYLATKGVVPGVNVAVLPRPYGGMINIRLMPEGESVSSTACVARVKGRAAKTLPPADTENGADIASISAASARDIRVK